MKIIEKDRYEGETYFAGEYVDMITGRLLTGDGEQYGWYAVNKIPDSTKEIRYVDPVTFKESDKLCTQFVIRRMKVDETKWQTLEVWIPVPEGQNPKDVEAFERAMGVLDGIG